jgi:hypothetical protein
MKRTFWSVAAMGILVLLLGTTVANRVGAGTASTAGCRSGPCVTHQTGVGRPVSVSTRKHGVLLRLSLAGNAYPRNALVTATVHLTNLTRTAFSSPNCPVDSFGAEVINQSTSQISEGYSLYPHLLPPPGAPWSDCLTGALYWEPKYTFHLDPDRTTVRVMHLVLRSSNVRAWAALRVSNSQSKPTLVETPVIHLKTTALPGPRLRFLAAPRLGARITPVTSGPAFYSEYAQCRTGNMYNASAARSEWSRIAGNVIRPFKAGACGTVTEWYLFIGQQGRPIAQLYYCTLGQQCTYGYLAQRYYCKGGRICTWFDATKRERAVAVCKLSAARFVDHGGFKPPLRTEVARYAMGLPGHLPARLTRSQRTTIQRMHAKCAPLLRR